jgi:hypothetical protein
MTIIITISLIQDVSAISSPATPRKGEKPPEGQLII